MAIDTRRVANSEPTLVVTYSLPHQPAYRVDLCSPCADRDTHGHGPLGEVLLEAHEGYCVGLGHGGATIAQAQLEAAAAVAIAAVAAGARIAELEAELEVWRKAAAEAEDALNLAGVPELIATHGARRELTLRERSEWLAGDRDRWRSLAEMRAAALGGR